ncbi:hypothetical protein CQA53_07930 [Helicobacter didelphidarum]|uniref:Uncharacterized protein n=1 Tax=Helicobacter didelphidarum TaxID=2040648 RepID=A0A3D8IHK6_9HELI|nr:hypothetical protein [Helicobacter didelphidarum]RDU64061.1 hypothetical protein CQA53_07930 [Helicobacter didelphidarum]
MQNLQSQSLAEDDVKIHLACKNVFLSLSLGFYLKGHLSAIDEADFIITDITNLKEKYAYLPICMIGTDLRIPCNVYEMFSQLHDFYSHVNAKQAEVFQKDMRNLQEHEFKKSHKNKISSNYAQINNKAMFANNQHHLDDSVDMFQNNSTNHLSLESLDNNKNGYQKSELIEAIKQKKMQEIVKNIDPNLSGQIETLFNELSQKIYDTINQTKK